MRTLFVILLCLPFLVSAQQYKVQKGKRRLYVYDSNGVRGSVRLRPEDSEHFVVEAGASAGYSFNGPLIKSTLSSSINKAGSGLAASAFIGFYTGQRFSLGVNIASVNWKVNGDLARPANIASFYLCRHFLFNHSELALTIAPGYVRVSNGQLYPNTPTVTYSFTGDGYAIGATGQFRYFILKNLFVVAGLGANRAYVSGKSVTTVRTGSKVTNTSKKFDYQLNYNVATIGIGLRF